MKNLALDFSAAKRRRKPWSDAELGEKIGRRIARHKMAKHFTFEVKDGDFTFARNEASIAREQDSVDLKTLKPVKLAVKGRHDRCVAFRAVPVVEAAMAVTLADELQEAGL